MKMNDFLIYAARLQDAGVTSLLVSLGSDKKRNRLMHVSPDSTVPGELAAKFPTRSFLLDGTDELLQQLKDDMVFSDDGPTPEKLAAAIERHPLAAHELREFVAEWKPMPADQDIELTDEEMADIEATAKRQMSYVRGLMRGLDANREKDSRIA
jgi:hypothetical protein